MNDEKEIEDDICKIGLFIGEYGGWKLERTVDYFMDFTRLVVDSVLDMVDYQVTFNGSHLFCLLRYRASAWLGGHLDMLEVAASALPTGVFKQATHWLTLTFSLIGL